MALPFLRAINTVQAHILSMHERLLVPGLSMHTGHFLHCIELQLHLYRLLAAVHAGMQIRGA